MKAVVVYESLYGNTHTIAEAVATGLREGAEVELVPVAEAGAAVVEEADLLVVGGPTHVHGMSSNLSRKGALEDSGKKGLPAPDVEGPALREWFGGIEQAKAARPAAAFDTRIGKSKLLTGSAAAGIAKRLKRHGYDVVGEESFIVEDTAGPLAEGEVDRAREWGRRLIAG